MMKIVGSRAEVMHGSAMKTAGGLKSSDLMMGDDGRIKSKAASEAALVRMKEEGKKAMVKVFKPKSGSFKLQPEKGTKEYKSKIKKMK